MTRATLALPPNLDERTLVRKLTHRVNSHLASAIDVVTAAAVRAEHPEAKVALGNITDLLQEQANVHRVLTIPEGDALVDAAEYLRQLCLATTRSRLEPIGVHLSFQADSLPLEAERCWRLGMAVHELLTNSARHACFDGRAGEIKIRLSLRDQVVNCIIADNGSLSGRLKPARGLGIVRDLIKSLGGRLEYGFGPEYSSFLLVFLLTDRERRANKAVASHEDAASTEDDQFTQADHDAEAPECRRHSVGPAWAYSGIKRAGRSQLLRSGPNYRRGGRPGVVARKARI